VDSIAVSGKSDAVKGEMQLNTQQLDISAVGGAIGVLSRARLVVVNDIGPMLFLDAPAVVVEDLGGNGRPVWRARPHGTPSQTL
jgi:hypothetical protein